MSCLSAKNVRLTLLRQWVHSFSDLTGVPGAVNKEIVVSEKVRLVRLHGSVSRAVHSLQRASTTGSSVALLTGTLPT
jgi:hypothetical protein